MGGSRMSPTRAFFTAAAWLGFAVTMTAMTQTALAGGLYLQEFATTDMGTASAGRGTTIHNPAGMTRLKGHQLFGGLGPGAGTTKFDATDDPVNTGGNGGEQGGFIPMLGGGYAHKLHDRIRLGVGVYSIAGASLDPENSWAGRNQMTEISLLTFAANPGVAVKVTDWLSVGANWIIVYSQLDWKLRAPAGGQVKIDEADDVGYAGMASVLFEPTEKLRFGLIYQSEVDMTLRGSIKVPPGGGTTANFDLDLPLAQRVGFSTYWDATDKIALLFEAGWEDWSTLDTTGVDIGGAISTSVPLAFQDTWRVGAGIHYHLNPEWMLQTGYSYDSSALKNKDRTAALPVDQQHRFGFGALHTYSESLRVGLNFEWVNLGKAKIRTPGLRGKYERNELFFVSLTVNWGTDSWRSTFGLDESG
jgi:long-chain fatty acid transport protein